MDTVSFSKIWDLTKYMAKLCCLVSLLQIRLHFSAFSSPQIKYLSWARVNFLALRQRQQDYITKNYSFCNKLTSFDTVKCICCGNAICEMFLLYTLCWIVATVVAYAQLYELYRTDTDFKIYRSTQIYCMLDSIPNLLRLFTFGTTSDIFTVSIPTLVRLFTFGTTSDIFTVSIPTLVRLFTFGTTSDIFTVFRLLKLLEALNLIKNIQYSM